ncbi:hypothetical protein BDW59DRAFT_156238 [Aspergillus cavernicola]|uniref:Suppressor of anucleate metulae protein B n=1 Tax=Aspergillus cavernicola TaxID=176166 RepID=A0ABR4J5G6_9EURO
MSESRPLSSLNKAQPGPAPDGLGTGLFANKNIRTGEDVLHFESPFVAVLETQRLEDTCSGCFGKRQLETDSEDNKITLKACTGCQIVKYCDKTCQVKDWKAAHSLECGIYQTLKPRVLPINARAILRMVLRTGASKNGYTSQDLEELGALETHIQEIRNESPAQWERIALTSKAVKEYSGTEMEEEMISAYGAKLDLNSFNLTSAVYDRTGLYLHPFAALMNHSCNYNCVVGFDGPELYVKAIYPIQNHEQIFISYVDATNPVDIRKKELRERYFFECRCEKCSSETPASQDRNISEEAEAVAKDAYALLESGSASDDSWKLSETIQNLISHSWPKTQQPFISVLDESITADIARGEFGYGFLNSALRYLHIDRDVYSESHPIRAVHAWTLAKMAIYISQANPNFTLPGFVRGRDALGLIRSSGVSVDYGLIAWSVLVGLVARKAEICIVPGLKQMVEKAFLEVHGEFMTNGLDPRGMGEEIRKEWVKVREVLQGYLTEIFGEDV